MTFTDNLKCETMFKWDDETSLMEILQEVKKHTYKAKKVVYYNVPAAFDIETTSFFENRETGEIISSRQFAMIEDKKRGSWKKQCCMYIWMFGIYGRVFYGRTWVEYGLFINLIIHELSLCDCVKLTVGVHNLSFEFQWIKGWFNWDKVFATDKYEPLYAESKGVIYRCTYRQTGKSLEKVGNDLLNYQIPKLAGDLDYDVLRHSGTPLTDKELGYCCNDVRVVMAFLQEQIELEGKVHKMPYTKTGYIRRRLKKKCFDTSKDKWHRFKYTEFIKNLTLTVDEYYMLKAAFQGGFTHASAIYTGEIIKDGFGVDIASDYPGICISEVFPMSKGKKRKVDTWGQLKTYLNHYCCLFTVRFYNIRAAFHGDHYISLSRCLKCDNPVVDNGRVVSADYVVMTITEQDFFIIWQWYKWEKIQIGDFYTYIKGYLPKEIISLILDLYEQKTKLKGVEGEEVTYMLAKQDINSIFGCFSTDIIHQEIVLTNNKGWEYGDIKNDADEIEKYNSSRNRTMFFPWGVWVAAYGRRNICHAIKHMCEKNQYDYIYSDTDSIKGFHWNDHKAFFDNYNKLMTARVEKALAFHGFDLERGRPKTPKGVSKQIGIFEYESTYKQFKALGAKRYISETDDGFTITIAGLAKKAGRDYMMEEYGDNVFEQFKDGLHVPAIRTGKLTHTYIEEAMSGSFIDYLGNVGSYDELSGVHLTPADFSLNLSGDYIKFLRDYQMRGLARLDKGSLYNM